MSNKKILQGHNKALESLATIAGIPLAKEGLTAWAKYNYLPKINLTNPTFKANVTSTGITITEASFDLSLLTEENYKEILNGFHYQSNSYMRFEFNSSGTLYWYSTSSSASEVTGYSNGVITTTTIHNNLGEQDFIYDGEKVFRAESKTLVGYVVSDDENAYPDGGIQDGYYYEKVVDGIPPEIFGCTKMAIDTFTVPQDTVSVTVNHSLGEKPVCAIIVTDVVNVPKNAEKKYPLRLAIVFPIITSGVNIYTAFLTKEYLTNDGDYATAVKYQTQGTVSASQLQIIVDSANGFKYIKAGTEYTLITMA